MPTWDADLLNAVCGEYGSDEAPGFSITSENGKPAIAAGGKSVPLLVISDRYAVRRGPFGDVNIEILRDENRGVYALRYGSRIVPKIK